MTYRSGSIERAIGVPPESCRSRCIAKIFSVVAQKPNTLRTIVSNLLLLR